MLSHSRNLLGAPRLRNNAFGYGDPIPFVLVGCFIVMLSQCHRVLVFGYRWVVTTNPFLFRLPEECQTAEGGSTSMVASKYVIYCKLGYVTIDRTCFVYQN